MGKLPTMIVIAAAHMPALAERGDGQPVPTIHEQMVSVVPVRTVTLEYEVDPTGAVKTCRVIQSGDIAQLDTRSCRWLETRRALRLPPETKHRMKIGWKLPDGPEHLENVHPEIYVNYFRSDDYPPEALKRRMEGRVATRSTVGSDGTLRDCKIVESSGHDLLDQTTCKLLLRRARFSPALNKAGEPIESSYPYRVVWGLPQ